jgi:MoaA/NifB/PqqE/SkfB family radical SAM enzyme
MAKKLLAWRLARIAWAYKTRQTQLDVGPLRLWVEPTNVCNLRCPMCLTPTLGGEVPKGLMSLATFERVIEQVTGHVRDANLFLGGEPLINKQLPAMIKLAGERGIKTRLHTNGTLLNEERAHALLDAGLDFLSFSFDGADEATYQELRPGGSFQETCENIQRFGRLRTERGKGPRTVVQLIERPEWTEAQRLEQRDGLKRLFDGPGIDEIKPIRMHNFGGLLPEQHFLAGRTFSPCSFLWYALNVSFDGTVVPCCLDFARKYPVGDLKTQSLMEVWNGPLLVALREKMIAEEAESVPLCKGCDVPYKPTLMGIPVRDRASLREFVRGVLPRR